MEVKQTKKLDRRQARTKRQIREALMELLEESTVDKITVKALAERADIDRKTFYLHYGSIGDLLSEIQDELLQEVLQLTDAYDLFQPDFDALGLFRQLNDLIGQNSDFYRRLVIADQYNFFYSKLKDSLKDFLHEKYHQREALSTLSPVKLDLYAEYVTAGVMSIYVAWLKNPAFDLEEVAEAVSEITYGGVRAVLDSVLARKESAPLP
ncbi:MAG: TetR/AcrR family transcriptional regulator [Clostridiales bacterium]|nr:TetR/AcrR family transcriptional regulator [Clostridiales bacterium]MDY4172103.1 TetR/AcrR family transcriptional regulator [Evtepia sp.]